jgi:hypothetical protein
MTWYVHLAAIDWTEVRHFNSYPEALAEYEACVADADPSRVAASLVDFRGYELLTTPDGAQGFTQPLGAGFWRWDEVAEAMVPS